MTAICTEILHSVSNIQRVNSIIVKQTANSVYISQQEFMAMCRWHMPDDTVPLDLNFTYARAQKAAARNVYGNAPE